MTETYELYARASHILVYAQSSLAIFMTLAIC
jgi:hypothetical protein